ATSSSSMPSGRRRWRNCSATFSNPSSFTGCAIRTSTDRQVLSFTVVGCHGREWTPAFALASFGLAGRLTSSALVFLLAAATARAQPATRDLASEFAGRVAAAITPGTTVHLVCAGDDGATQLELGRSLAARGIRLAESGDRATRVRCSCLENL